MRRHILLYLYVLAGALVLTSCLGDDDEVEYSSSCSLLTFSLSDFTYKKTITLASDSDSTYTVTAVVSHVEFTVDQTKRLVYNTDSVGFGLPLTAVPVKCTADGKITYKKEGEEVSFSSGDTLDVTQPLVFTVTSLDKKYSRDYTITVNAYKADPKATVWTKSAQKPDLNALLAEQNALAEAFVAQHPADYAYAFAYPLKTNSSITRYVCVSYDDPSEPENPSDTLANVWTRLSTEEKWTEIVPTRDNPYGCPLLKNLCVVRYGGDLYAFGGRSVGNRHTPSEPFGAMYVSIDHGITWRTSYTGKLTLPEELLGYEGTFRAAVDDEDFLWIVLEDGTAWKGRMNSLKH